MSVDPNSHLHIALPYDAGSFNEIWRNFTGAGGYFVANNIYARLVILDIFETGEIYPDLADSWEILDGGQRYIFHLNRSASWHDGVPVTAHDVVYTYREVLDNGYHGLSWIQEIDEIRALDDHTVECVLDAPNAAFLAQLGSFVFSHIVAKHLYEDTDWNTNPHNWEPIGNGPFRFKEWIRGERIEMVANADYWRDGPYVASVTYHIVPDREDAHAMLERGEVHHTVHDVPAADLDTWKSKPGIAVRADRGNALAFLSFNWTQERFQDRRVREAIARAIDRREIADAIYSELDTPRTYYLDNITWAFNPEAVAPEKDLVLAEKLLDSAGYPRGADGMRMHTSLYSLSLYPHYGVAAIVMQRQLSAIGIYVTPEALTPVDWLEVVQKQGDFDLAIVSGDIGPDPHQMASFVASDGPRNVMRYSNAIVDDCFRRGRGTIDRDRRGRYYRRLQAAMAADIARVPFLRYGEYLPYRTEYTGWSWSDGVRGTVPVWHLGKVRRA